MSRERLSDSSAEMGTMPDAGTRSVISSRNGSSFSFGKTRSTLLITTNNGCFRPRTRSQTHRSSSVKFIASTTNKMTSASCDEEIATRFMY